MIIIIIIITIILNHACRNNCWTTGFCWHKSQEFMRLVCQASWSQADLNIFIFVCLGLHACLPAVDADVQSAYRRAAGRRGARHEHSGVRLDLQIRLELIRFMPIMMMMIFFYVRWLLWWALRYNESCCYFIYNVNALVDFAESISLLWMSHSACRN